MSALTAYIETRRFPDLRQRLQDEDVPADVATMIVVADVVDGDGSYASNLVNRGEVRGYGRETRTALARLLGRDEL